MFSIWKSIPFQTIGLCDQENTANIFHTLQTNIMISWLDTHWCMYPVIIDRLQIQFWSRINDATVQGIMRSKGKLLVKLV